MRSLSFPALLCCAALAGSVAGSAQTPAPSGLQAPSAFASISDPAERSRAMFAEAAKVLTHPRCMNCHPASDRPLQGNDKHPHQPLVTRETTCMA
ncbi:MAG TPA: Isoquinoline 1-oxidoreductase subunit, partial [Methyloceanibacter sp.]|nr:Isoquinoline 1-oxidoreductase subunit [Methyloceanibacter sp.]